MSEIDLEDVISSWPSGGLREGSHLWWEIAEAFRRGQPVKPYEAVSGCSCIRCTGVIPPSPDGYLGKTSGFDGAKKAAQSVDILAVLDRLGCEPRRRGRKWVAKCPLHEDTNPSMSVDTKNGLWYCFPCAVGGDGIELWKLARNVDFKNAVRDLS